MNAENIRPNIIALDEAAARSGLPTYSELVEALRAIAPHAGWTVSINKKPCEEARRKVADALARIPA